VRQAVNLGSIANFTYVLDEAVGDYFMWAAHDDRRHPIALERMMEVFSSYENVGLVFSNMSTSDLNTDVNIESFVGHIAPSARKYLKYIFRLANGCPSLIYGLHRKTLLKNINLTDCDFMDVHLTHWYELNSSIMVVPLNLYTAGTDGIRVPYSLVNERLGAKEYLRAEWILLRKNFGFLSAALLYLVAAYLMCKNVKHLRKTFGI